MNSIDYILKILLGTMIAVVIGAMFAIAAHTEKLTFEHNLKYSPIYIYNSQENLRARPIGG